MLISISHIEFYVNNAFQASFFYKNLFKFSMLGYAGLNARSKDNIKYFLNQGSINIILTSSSDPKSYILKHVLEHDDSVRDIAFFIKNVETVFNKAISNGAKIVTKPQEITIKNNKIQFAQISTFGDVIHSLINYEGEEEQFFLDFYDLKIKEKPIDQEKLFRNIDHVTVCVDFEQLNYWTNFYADVFDMIITHEESIHMERSGMNSRVMQSRNGRVKLVFTEPVEKQAMSQIKEFIKYNNGAGVQHLAFETDNIVKTVSHLYEHDFFIKVPDDYYKKIKDDFPELKEKISILQSLDVLVDKDKQGYLYQIFTKPIQIRPTYFFEIIQREGSKGFGSNNIKALFKLIQTEQEKRGNL